MRLFILIGLFFINFATPAYAQLDEIVVTGSRIMRVDNKPGNPGIFIEKKGDFLLLQVTIENDSRELSTRLEELEQTINNMMEAAKSHPDIELSLVEKGNIVRSLSVSNFNSNVIRGRRPDTSMAHFKVKTNIPVKVADSFKLATKLAKFIDSVEEVGRTKIIENDQVAVSIINPYQYRGEVRAKIIEEINETTQALGGDYRAIITGLDGPVKWTRSGDLNLAFYMDYGYEILPKSIAIYKPDG